MHTDSPRPIEPTNPVSNSPSASIPPPTDAPTPNHTNTNTDFNSGTDAVGFETHSLTAAERFSTQRLDRGSHVDPDDLRTGKYTPDGHRVPMEHRAEQALKNAEWLRAERMRLERSKGDPVEYARLAAAPEIERILATRHPLGNAQETDLPRKAQAAQAFAHQMAREALAADSPTDTDATATARLEIDRQKARLDENWRDPGTKMHAFDPASVAPQKRHTNAIRHPERAHFMPMTRADMADRGWQQCDFILVTGDAYVDHPSFANGAISRVLEWAGYKVGIIAQPIWTDTTDISRLGLPRLGFLVSAGNLDSMLNAYTAHKLPRSDDPYSPGGKPNCRPPRATIVYCNLIRRAFGKVPIIVGGIEASQRRFSHYDYWEDRVRRSIVLDSNADLLVFGMGERQIVEIAHRLHAGEPIRDLTDIRGTAFARKDISFLHSPDYLARFGEPQFTLPHETLLPDSGKQPERVQEHQPTSEPPAYRKNYAIAFKKIYDEQDPVRGRPLVQKCGALHVVQLPPAPLQSEEEMDRWYDLPYSRAYHPDYEPLGGVPAWKTTQHSIITHRGCMGSCTFCAIWMHQGRTVQSRSVQSIVRETEAIAQMPDFKGYIADVGGPTANMYGNFCAVQQTVGACQDRDCLLPDPCPALRQHLEKQLDMLAQVRNVKGVKKAFIASGIRYDMLIDDQTAGACGNDYIDNLAANHTSGQLKVAPEHTSDDVLRRMRKPPFAKYEIFKQRFEAASEKAGKKQFMTAYFVSSHPGCTMDEQIRLAEYFKQQNWSPQQVQDFIPTPMTPATAMFYSGYDPETMELVYTPTTMREKRRQRALMQFRRPDFHGRVRKALRESGRSDLIGKNGHSLVPDGNDEDWDDDHPARPAGIGDGPASTIAAASSRTNSTHRGSTGRQKPRSADSTSSRSRPDKSGKSGDATVKRTTDGTSRRKKRRR